MSDAISLNSDDKYFDSVDYHPHSEQRFEEDIENAESNSTKDPLTQQSELQEKLKSLQQKLKNVQERRVQTAKCIEALNKQHDRLATYKNQVEKQYYSIEISQLHSIAMRTQSNHDWLALTDKINALNDCFHIWHRGQFGTINGLRMGSDVPPIPIPEDMKAKANNNGTDSTFSMASAMSGASTSNEYHMHNSNSQSDLASHAKPDSRDSNLHNVNSQTAIGHSNASQSTENSNTSTGQGTNTNTSNVNANINSYNRNVISSSLTTGPPTHPHSYNHFKVPWSEVNAALGTAALLLATLEENRNNPIRFHAHKIMPMGSFSKIVLLPQPPNSNKSAVTYNLFSDDSFSLFGKRNFNIALNALLKCLKDAVDIALEKDRTMAFPHEIGYLDSNGNIIPSNTSSLSPLTYYNSNRGDLCIGGLSISYGTDGERWTRALKYFLTDLKWLVAFVVKHVDR